MYLCYADESGFNGKKYNPKQPVQVMAAICPNVYNFHRTDSEFREVFNLISREIPISELKGEQIYRGKGSWHNVSSEMRDKVIEHYLNWLIDRKHKLIVTAIDNEAFFDLQKRDPGNQHFSAIPSSMTQVVDIVAYLFRLHIEFKSYGSEEAYYGEAQKIAHWISRIESKLLNRRNSWKADIPISLCRLILLQ